ncbi:MAG: hypothetical protein U1F76_19270 [Candidatus Competibacteraceae bacterium]
MPTKTHRSAYADLIAEATGAPEKDLPALEVIMRNEVFHSTLDWQSRQAFMAGARKAMKIFLSNRRLYEAELAFHQARFLCMQAEDALACAEASNDPTAIRIAAEALAKAKSEEAAARTVFEACLGHG